MRGSERGIIQFSMLVFESVDVFTVGLEIVVRVMTNNEQVDSFSNTNAINSMQHI